MSVGFRKSMFGFNRDDVNRYIETLNKSHSDKENALKSEVSDLNDNLNRLREELGSISAEKERIQRSLDEYTEKYDEIERLSQNIGKLYLVAQSNARAVMKNSAQNRDTVKREVEENLNSIDSAHISLDGIRAKMIETSNDFVARLDTLMTSLESARELIDKNDTENLGRQGEFERLYSEISK